MKQLIIKVYMFGKMPFEINVKRIKCWSSSLFKIDVIKTIKDEARIYFESDGFDNIKPIKDEEGSSFQSNEFNADISKQTINLVLENFKFIKHDELVDINLIVGYMDIGDDWFLCSLKDKDMENTIILSYHKIYDELVQNNIPLENLILSAIYTYSLIYLKNGRLPTKAEEMEMMHLDTRGCLFDFTNDVTDVKFFANYPIICPYCQVAILPDNIDIKKINKELRRIRKNFFYRLYENIKSNILIYVLLTSFLSALLTKATTSSTYTSLHDIIIMCALAVASAILLVAAIINAKKIVLNHYSQKNNSQRTK